MKRSSALALVVELMCALCATAQVTETMSADITQAYTAIKVNILKTADKMPEENYSFKPTSEVRSFADVLYHVAESQMRTCGAVAGDQTTLNRADQMTKKNVNSALEGAFAECDKAYGSLSDANAGETIVTAHGRKSRLGALAGNVAHDSEQYGILAMYLRLKGIVPPSSERPAK